MSPSRGAVEFGFFCCICKNVPRSNSLVLSGEGERIGVEIFLVFNLETSCFLKESPGFGELLLLFINLKAKLKYLEVGHCPSSSLPCQLQKSKGMEYTKPALTKEAVPKPKAYIFNIYCCAAVNTIKKGLN